MEVAMTNTPLKSKINAVQVISILLGLFAMPEMLEMGIKPEYLIFGQGILTLILRTFFNQGGVAK